MQYTLTEARVNQSDLLNNEARLAVEATVNHGMAQLRQRFDRSRHITGAELLPSRASALRLEPGFLAFMDQSRAVVPNSYTRPASHEAFVNASTIVGGLVINRGQAVNLRIDPLTPLPEEGRPGAPTDGQVREVRVFAKATTEDRLAGTRTAFARQTFQVVDRSLFQNAVFFNGVLEIFAGGVFNVGMGNAPIYGAEVFIGNNNRVHTRIESAGGIFARRYGTNQGNATANAFLANFDVFEFDPDNPPNFNNVDYLVGLTDANPGAGALQTGVANFRELALQAFSGGLLTAEHGIVPQAAPGLEFLREWSLQEAADAGDNFAFPDGRFDQGEFDRRGANWGHHLIAPSRSLADLSDPGLDPAERDRLEALNTLEANKFSNRSSLVIEFDPGTGPGTETVRMFHQPFVGEDPEFFGGQRVRHEIDIEATFPDPDTRFWEVSRFEQSGNGNDVTGGIYDFRQGGNRGDRAGGRINLLRVDVERMRHWVEGTSESDSPPSFDPQWWNGGVFVTMPEQNDPGRIDRVVPARSDWAIQLFNGRTIPNRRPLDASVNPGMTFSTNSALYVQGDFNAPDGANWSRDSFGIEQGAEAPAALVADAIMLLSNDWDNRDSGRPIGNRRSANRTDFSAALIMGNVPSQRDRGYSGGLENFPRFLEDWNNRTAAYRGSLIRLFRSESFDAAWPATGTTYNAPRRDWAFHTGFRELTPPLDMGQRTFRRIFFRELTEAEFRAQTAALFEQ
ncbi:MAG: hypothetical protein JJT96_19400 [Opitutales bacterium]|nr:hypothetical protein [Opitutales bacterium]